MSHFYVYNPETVRSKDTCMAEESNGISSNMGSNLMKMMGLRNSTKHDKNLKVSSLWLFAYSNFVSLTPYFSESVSLICRCFFHTRSLLNSFNVKCFTYHQEALSIVETGFFFVSVTSF